MSHNKRRKNTAMEKGLSDLEAELKQLSMEVESVNVHSRSDQPPMQTYRPTYRAVLAKKGFLVRNTLGSGSYSKVKMALSLRKYPDRVAVKIVDRLKAPQDYQQKFMPRELELWPRLFHPHIVKLHEVFEESSRVFMVLEYAENGDALKYIQNNGAITESKARSWCLQIGEAVRYLHDQNITHRDLKLENLLLDADFNVKISDFGFIKEMKPNMFSQTYCGSKSYAAPEILTGSPYDPRKADVWALGVILYIFVTGKMPFDETKGTKSIIQEQKALAFKWTKSRRLSSNVKEFVRKMFTWDFRDRIDIHGVLADPWFHIPSNFKIQETRWREGTETKTGTTSGSAAVAHVTRRAPRRSLSDGAGFDKQESTL